MAPPVRIAALGGLGEVGMNCLVLECDGRLLVVDCGVMFPGEPVGVDVVVPDLSWLRERREQVEAILVTHGHEDHIGALPLLLREVRAPVHGPRLALALLRPRLAEAGVAADLREAAPGDVRGGGPFRAELVHVTHSIPDACALAIETPQGTFLHSGDFKIDQRPVDGRPMDLGRIEALGRRGVRLLLSDSTNAERPGWSLSESAVGEALGRLLDEARGRVVVSCFASNLHRIELLARAARSRGRRLLLLGRAMQENVRLGMALGYLSFPPWLVASAEEARSLAPRELCVLATGTQGEPRSALARLSRGEHADLSLAPGDLVVLSSRFIPGNEVAIAEVVNALVRLGAEVVYEDLRPVHASGHAQEAEQRRLIALAHPEHFLPIHGELRHLVRHAAHAAAEGLPEGRRHVAVDGEVLEVSGAGVRRAEPIPAGRVFADRDAGFEEVAEAVVRDRRRLAEVGLVVVVLVLDRAGGAVVRGPEVLGLGAAGLAGREPEIASAVQGALADLPPEVRRDPRAVEEALRLAVRRWFRREEARRPAVLPVVLEV
ncbi:MAG TPA: ribonuclease J [Anaeromyxobacteraceae bacterium]|nr:ribonuclease J [Anaeromyxobacteraceae bacterium]